MPAAEMSFGELLRACRVTARLTQERLAERAGLSTRTVRALERGGDRGPRPPSLSSLATALELTGAERDRFLRLGRERYWSRRGGARPPDGAGAAVAGPVPGELRSGPPAGTAAGPGDLAHAALVHRSLALASRVLCRYDEAHVHLRRALDLSAGAGDLVGQAHTHLDLADLWERQGRPDRSLDHGQQALTLLRRAAAEAGAGPAVRGTSAGTSR